MGQVTRLKIVDLSALDLIPDNRRGVLEHWLTHSRDETADAEQWRDFWHNGTTPQEIRAFVSPFECADDLYERIMLLRAAQPDPVDQDTLITAVRDYVRELAGNARQVDEALHATRVEAVESYRIVDRAEFELVQTAALRADDDSQLSSILQDPIWDAAGDDVIDHPEPAAASLAEAVRAWYLPTDVEFFLLQPFLRAGLDFSAAYRLWNMGCDTLVTSETVFISYTPTGPVPQPPVAPVIKGIAAKDAARAGVDWTDFPTSQAEIAALRAAGEDGDHPSLAKLSLMQMGAIGVPFDLPGALVLLERAAGDYPSVVACYQTGQELGLAAADYGMYYLACKGWGVPESKDGAEAHLRAAAERGFPHAMYLLGRDGYRSDTIEVVREAENWLIKAAASGYHHGFRMLYHLYEEGELEDAAKAFFWLKRAANEHASSPYQLWLGRAYEKGEATPKDDIQAFTWYYLASCQVYASRPSGIEEMQRLLATMNSEDIDVATAQALAWIEHNAGRLGHFDGAGPSFTNPSALN